MDHGNIIEGLIAGFELDTELGRLQAYARCLEYANVHLENSDFFHGFLDSAAHRLGQGQSRREVRGQVGPTGEERLYLYFDKETGPNLVGNRDGFRYLEGCARTLGDANADLEHISWASGEPPLCPKSYPFEMRVENNQWFEKYVFTDDSVDNSGDDRYPERNINLDDVEAVQLLGESPPELILLRNVIYRVVSHRPTSTKKTWEKRIRRADRRMSVFAIECEDGKTRELALDLDDRWVVFLTARELRNVRQR